MDGAKATLMMVLPQVAIGPPLGTLIDRWNHRRTIIAADGLIALLSLAPAGLFWARQRRVWHVYLERK